MQTRVQCSRVSGKILYKHIMKVFGLSFEATKCPHLQLEYAKWHLVDICKAQGATERTERKTFEPERFFELGRTRIGLERSGCTEM